jgi:hypothetical protein
MIVFSALERIEQQMKMTYSKTLSQPFPGETEESTKELIRIVFMTIEIKLDFFRMEVCTLMFKPTCSPKIKNETKI